MRINTNLIALNTKNQLKKNNKTTSNIMEKLSSGKRINKAADDAAGLAISQKMRAQIRGLDQANENVQDGVSLIQTAEGALNEMEAMTQRMRELSVQGANDTLTTEDREKIQKELDALKGQVDVIANTTEFNTKKLLDGSISSGLKEVKTTIIKTHSINVNTEIPVDGSRTNIPIDIEGNTLDFSIEDDLNGNIVTEVSKDTNLIGSKTLKKSNPIIWEKSFGGSQDDITYDMKSTSDGGYITIGMSNSSDSDVSNNAGNFDIWLSKHDEKGDLVWEKSFGGSSNDSAWSINQTSDGGYIIAGETESSDGDFSSNNGSEDAFAIKVDSTGNLQWKTIIGGTDDDYFRDIIQTSDGGYIAVGDTWSNDGDITDANNGINDALVVRMDINGNILWQKSIGGTSQDSARSIKETDDGGYLVAGGTKSDDGDVNIGERDMWLMKLDSSGSLSWEKRVGTSAHEFAYDFEITNDGGYIIGGSKITVGEEYNGLITKTDQDGNEEWKYEVKGSQRDVISSVTQTSDGGYFAVGYSSSNDWEMDNNGGFDIIAIKLDSNGNEEWKKNFGGSLSEKGFNGNELSDGNFIISGYSQSSDQDINLNKGGYDRWLAKISIPISGSKTHSIILNDIIEENIIEFNNVEMEFNDEDLNQIETISFDYSVSKTKQEYSNGLNLQVGSNEGQSMEVSVNDMRSEALGMTNGYPKVIPRENAEISIEISDKAIRKLNNERAKLGAKQNRLEHVSKNLINTSENLQSAESRIEDADMAKQAIKLAKNDILIQASQYMLSQANVIPQSILELIK